MSKDLMREQFESWAIARGQSVLRQGAGYAAERTGMAWLCWQASREAVVVELESHYCYDRPGDAYAVIQDCKEAIEALGLKVAP